MCFISQIKEDIFNLLVLSVVQNVTVSEHNNHSYSFQVKFPNVFMNYTLGAVRIEDQKFKDWDNYKFTMWQTQLNFVFFLC